MRIVIKKFGKADCRPCKILANYLTEINFEELDTELVEVDINENPEVVERYKLSSVPVLVFERNGMEIARLNGLIPPDEVKDVIEYAKYKK